MFLVGLGGCGAGPARPAASTVIGQPLPAAGPADGQEPVANTAAPTAPSQEPGLTSVVDAGVGDAAVAAADGVHGEEPPLTRPTPVEDPSGDALAHFHTALRAAGRGERKARIAFYGASHVAADLFTDVIRRRLQARFGDGGPGALMPAKPWRWHRHAAVEYLRERALDARRVKARAPREDAYGLMGVAFDSGKLRAISRIRTRAHPDPGGGGVDSFELYYRRQPGGGRVRVMIDGVGVRTLRTAAERAEPGYARFEVPEGVHEFELRTQADGPVRIYSVIAERGPAGVVLDTLGIPGARARYHLQWQDPPYRAHLARRNPDLVVLAYGTNESGDDDVPIESYEARVRRVVKRIRQTVPEASCLLVGPSDRPVRETPPEPPAATKKKKKKRRKRADEPTDQAPPPTYAPRPRTAEIVAAQRRVSAELGCGFFDVVDFMGGELSMLRWVAADPPLGAPDHVHYTRRGYEALGAQLHDAMMAGFVEDDTAAGAVTPGE